jgi:hypothetical protein
VAVAGIDPSGFSGHSLRAGFVTNAIQAGVSTRKVRAQTGHASDAPCSPGMCATENFLSTTLPVRSFDLPRILHVLTPAMRQYQPIFATHNADSLSLGVRVA